MSAQGQHSSGFAPLARADARILILGSLPSQRSIAANEYYAHPQNAFWRIMAALVGADGNYSERCAALTSHSVALWDVLASSVRPGSLDADIQMSTAEVNDFKQFLAVHTALERICFNGQKAARIFSKRVPEDVVDNRIELITLPSTSPAHAAMHFDEKLELWRTALKSTFAV
jgi:TDG/mug DNA glycosylase family protein